MQTIEQAAKQLAEAQELFDSAEASYLNGHADLLELRAASGALHAARWRLRRAHTEARTGQEATA
jgi:hypothetical protein